MSATTPPDPYRIKRILNKLETAWETMPEEDLTGVLFRVGLGLLCEYGEGDENTEKTLDTYLKDHSLTSTWKS